MQQTALAWALGTALAAVLSQNALAGDSFISIQGNFSAPNQVQTFDFSLGSNALMIARTWGNPGGTNAAGELIASGGIDSLLKLYDANVVQLASDDDGGGGLNSQIANIYPAASYLLKLSNPFAQGDGHWGTDISAGTNITASIEAPNGATIRSVTLGANAGGTAQFLLSAPLQVSSTFTIQSGGRVLQSGVLSAPTMNLQPGGLWSLNFGNIAFNTFNQTGGSLAVNLSFAVADANGSNAQYNMSGGDLNASILYVGNSGAGVFNQTAGTVSVSTITLGQSVGGTGIYSISGPSTVSATNLLVGSNGQGAMVQSDGMVTVTNLNIGSNAAGTYSLNGGALTVTNEFVGAGDVATFTQSGGSHSVHHLVISRPGFPSISTYNLQSGTLAAGSIDLNQLGTFNQTGGTLNPTTFNEMGGTILGIFQNQGTFNYSSGNFNGRLLNQGVVILNADFLAGDGLDNQSTFDMGARLITLNGFGLNNTGTVTLAGAFLTGLGPLVNNNLMSGYGTISGLGGFTNNGTLSQGDGNLIIGTNTGNLGGIDLNNARVLQINTGIQLSNRGTLNLNGALVSGPGVLNNLGGGVIRGRGTISSTFLNTSGTLLVDSVNVNATGGFGNGGLVLLKNQGGLAGGTINNFGRIQGDGSVGNAITNNGRIEAVGTLSLGGAVTNNAAGLLTAGAGSTLLMSNGLPANAGTINLTGGSFDNNGFPLDNTGQISGFGVIYSGGLTNHGTITFTGGFSTINGNVTNTAGKQLRIAYNPALFTGNVTNNGILKNTSTTVTFAGTYTENGTFISDPADNFFNDVNVGEEGAWVGGVGDRFFLSGDLLSSSKNKSGWQTAEAELKFLGGGDHVLSVLGEDRGISFDGYSDNFAWGTLALGAGDALTLADGDGVAGGALYVHNLLLAGGVAQITSIESGGLNIYYHLGEENAYLGGQTYALAGGGTLSAVPEPGQMLAAVALWAALLARRRIRTMPTDRSTAALA